MSGGYNPKFNPFLRLSSSPPKQPSLGDILAGLPPPPPTLGDLILGNPALTPPSTTDWTKVLVDALVPKTKPGGFGGLSASQIEDLLNPAPQPSLADIFAESLRHRGEWNNRLAHWAKAPSESEKAMQYRAHLMVSKGIRADARLSADNCTVGRQGSYRHRTNTRNEGDVDLRVVHPTMKVDYGDLVDIANAHTILRYTDLGRTCADYATDLRSQVAAALRREFGAGKVDTTGTKAIRVAEVQGSRVKVDVVPTLTYRFVEYDWLWKRYIETEGVALLGTDGRWAISFPEQNYTNGVSKHERTRRRFKRVVRMLKHMRADMKKHRSFELDVPSFLIECLVHAVEDEYFLFDDDDHYGLVVRVVQRMRAQLNSQSVWTLLREVNGIKMLFGPHQSWVVWTALAFADAVLSHLGDA
jgi:hypothetical protein